MCCFSQPVKRVSRTRIFARSGMGGRQFLVYQMQLSADRDVAMILPLPTPSKSTENDVRFVNLEAYPQFFDDMATAFPTPIAAAAGGSRSVKSEVIAVKDVGAFEASFVPTARDFARLDERFRLPSGTWDHLPQYRDFGFAVFKLKPGEKRIHPMAFDFPRRKPAELFFPTVHIHDGQVHDTADFDHTFFAQLNPREKFSVMDWRESRQPARNSLQIAKAQNLVDPDAHLYMKSLIGMHPNRDTILA